MLWIFELFEFKMATQCCCQQPNDHWNKIVAFDFLANSTKRWLPFSFHVAATTIASIWRSSWCCRFCCRRHRSTIKRIRIEIVVQLLLLLLLMQWLQTPITTMSPSDYHFCVVLLLSGQAVHQSQPFSLIICASSIMYLPSLYFWLDSKACSCATNAIVK